MNRTRLPLARMLAWSLALAAVALVGLSYLNPHLMLELANQVWACF